MKKLFLIIFVLVFTLTGCVTTTNNNKLSQSKQTPISTITATQIPVVTVTPEKKQDILVTQSPTIEKTINPDFRNIKWGMSKDDVLRREAGTPYSEENALAYDAKIANEDASLVYYFNDNGQLYQAMYLLNIPHTNNNDYIDDYSSLKKELTKKYGKPTQDKEVWKNDLYKDDYSQWGMAISIGHLKYLSQWKTDTTEVALFLNGDNYEIRLSIFYISTTIEKPNDDTQEAL